MPSARPRRVSRGVVSVGRSGRYGVAVTAFGVAYAVLHHLGLLPGGLGEAVDGSRWADWIDLLVPYRVIGPALWVGVAAPLSRAWWPVLAVGAIAYASGHGIHLAANSVANVAPGPTAYLWDEVVGHAIWYAGFALMAAAVASTFVGRPRPPWWGHLIALGVGVTWATNALGAVGWVWPAALVAVAACVVGWRTRRGLGVVLLSAGGSSLLTLAVAAVAT